MFQLHSQMLDLIPDPNNSRDHRWMHAGRSQRCHLQKHHLQSCMFPCAAKHGAQWLLEALCS